MFPAAHWLSLPFDNPEGTWRSSRQLPKPQGGPSWLRVPTDLFHTVFSAFVVEGAPTRPKGRRLSPSVHPISISSSSGFSTFQPIRHLGDRAPRRLHNRSRLRSRRRSRRRSRCRSRRRSLRLSLSPLPLQTPAPGVALKKHIRSCLAFDFCFRAINFWVGTCNTRGHGPPAQWRSLPFYTPEGARGLSW